MCYHIDIPTSSEPLHTEDPSSLIPPVPERKKETEAPLFRPNEIGCSFFTSIPKGQTSEHINLSHNIYQNYMEKSLRETEDSL